MVYPQMVEVMETQMKPKTIAEYREWADLAREALSKLNEVESQQVKESKLAEFVEWLKIENSKSNHTTTGIVWRHYDYIIDMGITLLAQEQAHKTIDRPCTCEHMYSDGNCHQGEIMNHTNYELSKALKAFMGESAKHPCDNRWWIESQAKPDGEPFLFQDDDELVYRKTGIVCYPAYSLEDILSRPFCKAMAKNHPHRKALDKYDRGEDLAWDTAYFLHGVFYNKGFKGVELALKSLIGR